MKSFFLALSLVWVTAAGASSARAESGREADLKAAHDEVMRQIRERETEYEREQSRLKEAKRGAADLAKKERRILKKLEAAEKALTKTRAELRTLTEQIAVLERDIRVTEEQWQAENESQAYRRRLMVIRMRALYAERVRSGVTLASAQDGGSSRMAREGMARLCAADGALIREIGGRKTDLEKIQALLQEKDAQLRAVESEKRVAERRQERERVTREKLLTEARSRKSGLEEQARQIEESSANLMILLTTLREQSLKFKEQLAYLRKDFDDRRGFMRWPVAMTSIRGVRPYGKVFDESIKTWRVNKGIDILTESNQSVCAVGKGEVVFSDFFGRMGNLVVVSHGGDYFTLYAHLSELAVKAGDRLEAGEVIGRAGNTGLLEDQVILHFEIRQGSQAVDPEPWLGRRK